MVETASRRAQQLRRGDTVADRYVLKEILGQGGMGAVWRGEDPVLRRPVAIKFGTRPKRRERTTPMAEEDGGFLAEARAAAKVSHPNVVTMLDFGLTDDGRPFIAMELLEGETLRQRLRREPRLRVGEFLDFIDQALAGLGAAHRAGLVHCDVKPDNFVIMSGSNEEVLKVVDFGVTRHRDGEPGDPGGYSPMAGVLAGTPAYMSPEQVRNLDNLDLRSDIFSVGVVLYEGLTGHVPTGTAGALDAVAARGRGDSFPLLHECRPELGEKLSRVVHRAMANERPARFGTTKELRDDLAKAGNGTLRTLETCRPAAEAPKSSLAMSSYGEIVGTSSGDVNLTTGISTDGLRPPTPDIITLGFPRLPSAPPPLTPPSWVPLGSFLAALIFIPAALLAVAVPLSDVAAERPTEETLVGPWASSPSLDGPSLPLTVSIDVGGLPEGSTLHIDGREVASNPVELPADGLTHRLEAKAAGFLPWQGEVIADEDRALTANLHKAQEKNQSPGRRRWRRRKGSSQGTARTAEPPVQESRGTKAKTGSNILLFTEPD